VILVTGATGMFGSRVLRESVARGAEVRGLVHSPGRTAQVEEAGAQAMVADLDRPETLPPALDGVERVFLVTPMDLRGAARGSAVIEAARTAGVRHIVKLHGAVRHRGDALDQQHQEAMRTLRASGLEWTLFSPQTVMETNLLGQAAAIRQTGAMWGTAGDGRAAMVAADDCGRAGGIVMTSEGHDGREYAITGPAAVSFAEIADTMTRVLGRPITYNDLPEDDFKAALVEQGMSPEEAEVGILLHYRAFRRGDAELVTGDYQQLTGQTPTTIETWLMNNASAFT
jgi:NAD(P)H dehydrogenase (quinone)